MDGVEGALLSVGLDTGADTRRNGMEASQKVQKRIIK